MVIYMVIKNLLGNTVSEKGEKIIFSLFGIEFKEKFLMAGSLHHRYYPPILSDHVGTDGKVGHMTISRKPKSTCPMNNHTSFIIYTK